MKLKTCPRIVVSCWLLVISLFVFASDVDAAETLYYLHQDHLGSTALVTDVGGKVSAKQLYYPFGQVRALSGQLPTDRGYLSQISDFDETGLDYYQSLYVNPIIGKFIQPDKNQKNKYNFSGVRKRYNLSEYNIGSKKRAARSENNPTLGRESTGIIDKNPNVNVADIASTVLKNVTLKNSPVEKNAVSSVDSMPLTEWGRNIKELYEAYKNTSGWWNNNEEGNFEPLDLANLIISFELSPLFSEPELSQPEVKNILAEATTRWFYTKCAYEGGGTCPGVTANAIFNWLGGGMGTAKRRWGELFIDENGIIRPNVETDIINRITPQYVQNNPISDFIVSNIINPMDKSWTNIVGPGSADRPIYWGNLFGFETKPKNYFLKFGEGSSAFYVLSILQSQGR